MPPATRAIYCTGCMATVQARLTDGAEIYPHRPDLAALPFWRCDTCCNYVGCHYKTGQPNRPLGVIATKELLAARMDIHNLLDPLWKSGRISRDQAYRYLTDKLGYTYHTGEIKSVEDARRVYELVGELHNELIKEKTRAISSETNHTDHTPETS